jgi:hypothetical protein
LNNRAKRSNSADGIGPAAAGISSLIVLVAVLLMLSATAASAATTHNPEPFSPITGAGSGLTIGEGSGVAIDEATGNVFVNDGGAGHGRVAILGREGGAPVGLAAPYEIPGIPFGGNSYSYGIAFDNSATSSQGTLYVNDPSTRGIRKYRRNPATERYEEVGELTVPNPGISVDLNVDGSGDLWAGTDQRVYELSPAGTILHEYGLVLPGANETLQGVVTDDAGDLFVVTTVGVYKYAADGAGEIDPTKPITLDSGFSGIASGIGYDPALNRVFAGLSKEVGEYDAASGERIDRFGEEVIGSAHGVTVDSANARIYVSERESSTGGHHDVDVFGPGVTVPTVTIGAATGITGTKASLSGSVNPEGLEVTECFFEWGEDLNGKPHYEHESACEPPAGSLGEGSAAVTVTAAISGLTANGVTYHYRLVTFNGNGRERTGDRTFETGTTVATEPATGVGPSTATLNGVVRPEGVQYTNCVFEYGLVTSFGFEHTTACNPSAESIGPDFTAHDVSLALTGLKSNSRYKFRVTATNVNGALSGETLAFTTSGPPQIGEVQSSDASQSAVTLQARINPSGFGTSYRFEWGPTSAYGNVAPVEFEPFIGSGTEPVLAKVRIAGLSAGTEYHYRVVAGSSQGLVESPDHIAETLNSCGLVEARCFELVSRREAGPVAIPGEANAHIEMHYQASTSPGGFAYPVETGYPEATKGAEVLYRAVRGPDEWESTQLSAPISALNERNDIASVNSAIEWLSDDLSCGFIESTMPLTPDPSMKLVREEGGSNLYRINPDNSYTPITVLPPKNAEGTSGLFNYGVAWGSQNCDVTVFSTAYAYPGVPGAPTHAGAQYLYEWRDGTLRNAGIVPGPGGEEVVVPAVAGYNATTEVDTQNAVSEDGSRIFISAERQTSPDPAEIGRQAVFVREDGRETRDVSLSETAVPDEGAQYQWATADGSKVFFTANAGLTQESNSEGTDLYEYNLETEKLTDRSITQASGGAQVKGFLGASADGSQVYFASRNQLVAGQGNSRTENVSADSYSIYDERGTEISFVGTFNERDDKSILIAQQGSWDSQVSPDGRYLLFESSARNTGYENQGVNEVYLYDADSEETTCVSCRQDGQPSPDERYGDPGYSLLARGESVWNPLHPPQFLTERNGEAQVFFNSPDALAPGAVAGENNIYEWAHDQIFRLASAPKGSRGEVLYPGITVAFGGASQTGSDVYLITPETLTWEDGDQRLSAYDARIGGGYPEPPPPPPVCGATSEGQNSCLGPPQGAAGTPGAATTGDAGAQNFEPRSKKQKKHGRKGKKHKTRKGSAHKRHKKKSQPKKQKKSKRQANGNRRNGK